MHDHDKDEPQSVAPGGDKTRRTDHLPAPDRSALLAGVANSGQLLALQRTAGNAAVTTLMTAQREPNKDEKYAGPTPTNPFDAAAVQPDIDQLAVDALRSMAQGQASTSYSDYGKAISLERTRLEAEEKDRKEQSEFVWSVALTIAMLPAGPVIASAIGGAIAGPNVQAKLAGSLKSNGPRLLKTAGIAESETAKWLTEEALNSVAVKALAAKFDAEKAKKGVEGAQEKLQGIVAKISAGTSVIQSAISYLEALENASSDSMHNLIDVINTADAEQLAGIYNAFRYSTLEVYKAQLAQQTENFKVQVAPVLASKSGHGTGESFAMVDAFGKPRLAEVRYLPSSANYSFRRWITPDMAPIVMAVTGGKPPTIPVNQIVGGIPDPLREEVKDRVVSIDAWGRKRLAVVQISDEWHLLSAKEFGVMTFLRWVPEAEQKVAEAKGAGQIGGINEVSPADVENLQQPALV